MTRKVVLGLGDVGRGDDGVGVHALKALGGRLGPQTSLELVDGGGLSAGYLLNLIEDCSHLLVLDALDMGRPAGSVIELGPGQISLYSGLQVSPHQLAFQEALELAGSRGHLPAHLQVVGAQPADLLAGQEMSPILSGALPDLVERAVKLLLEWGLAPSPALRVQPG
jgi:hydrogenase maturation protease